MLHAGVHQFADGVVNGGGGAVHDMVAMRLAVIPAVGEIVDACGDGVAQFDFVVGDGSFAI